MNRRCALVLHRRRLLLEQRDRDSAPAERERADDPDGARANDNDISRFAHRIIRLDIPWSRY
jgi:hypothetical protein